MNQSNSHIVISVPYLPTGRPLPLKYKIQASVMTPKGLVKSYPRHIKQDVIDKCRQEYLDFEIPLTEISRGRFTPGVDGDFGKYLDCFANIYPQKEAGVAFGLKNVGNSLSITSGYRSPRYNILKKYIGSSKNSTHIFGEAVDILPTGSATDWKRIWDAAPCPKILEYDKQNSILRCGADTENKVIKGSAFGSTGAKTIDDIRAFSGKKNCIHLGERNHN